jgi:hypothetical protein
MDINMNYDTMIKQIRLWKEMELFDKYIKQKGKGNDRKNSHKDKVNRRKK